MDHARAHAWSRGLPDGPGERFQPGLGRRRRHEDEDRRGEKEAAHGGATVAEQPEAAP